VLNGRTARAPTQEREHASALRRLRAAQVAAQQRQQLGVDRRAAAQQPALPMGYFGTGPIIASALQVFAHIYEERGKPAFNIARSRSTAPTIR
jgi:hypothetical protein